MPKKLKSIAMHNLKWWQKAVFYQIYPRSFADGNGDGIGDFQGITAKLEYLRTLGIDAIWLSPHYPSPFVDCGYDISDFTGVAGEYGSLADFQVFLNEAHACGIRVVADLVLNHSSDQHPWFVESRSNRKSPKRDWYIWRDGKDGGPPNDWVSVFGGTAWELDPTTGQYYYHSFLREQPDLNWRNPEVEQAMWDVARFWLDLGVDGFRLDAVGGIFEHPDLPDHSLELSPADLANPLALPSEKFKDLFRFQMRQPGLHELMRRLRALVDEYPGDRVLIGEDDDVAFHGTENDELHLVFNFPLMYPSTDGNRLTPAHIRSNQDTRLLEIPPGAWPCNTLGNHDCPRVWSRFGDEAHDAELARLHAGLLLTLKGTPFLYNGEEIGMTDLELAEAGQLRDTTALRRYHALLGHGIDPSEALRSVIANTRDRCRSPLQWNSVPNAGFSPQGIPTWLPVNPNHATGVNITDQSAVEGSLLSFYRRILTLRRTTPALVAGDYHSLHRHSEDHFAFLRHDDGSGQTCLVVLNFSNGKKSLSFDLPGLRPILLFSSQPREDIPLSLDSLVMHPFEILVANLK